MLLTLPDRSRLHWLAADRDQGALAIDAIRGFVARTPMLTGALDVQSWRVRFGPTDSTLDILATDAPSAWGIRSQGVFVGATPHPEPESSAGHSAFVFAPWVKDLGLQVRQVSSTEPSHPNRAGSPSMASSTTRPSDVVVR